MTNPKEILVTTTSSIEGVKINKYLKPVSAHIVAGTNFFSDFAASITDSFGGRSQSYQKQLTSLYDEAINKIKIAAFELGANCVLGLSVDMDEISGKGKAMFMLTAVGTAVRIEEQPKTSGIASQEKVQNVSLEKLITLEKKNAIIQESTNQYWNINDDAWEFIIENQVEEVLPALLKRYQHFLGYINEESKIFHQKLIAFFNNLPEPHKSALVYSVLFNEKDEKVGRNFIKIIKDLQLIDYEFIRSSFDNEDFQIRKRGLQLVQLDKPYYNKQDVVDLNLLKSLIIQVFQKRGTLSTKKALLSNKEKEIWICECGKSNDADQEEGDYCLNCKKDIYGFFKNEMNPLKAVNTINKKTELINHFLA